MLADDPGVYGSLPHRVARRFPEVVQRMSAATWIQSPCLDPASVHDELHMLDTGSAVEVDAGRHGVDGPGDGDRPDALAITTSSESYVQ